MAYVAVTAEAGAYVKLWAISTTGWYIPRLQDGTRHGGRPAAGSGGLSGDHLHRLGYRRPVFLSSDAVRQRMAAVVGGHAAKRDRLQLCPVGSAQGGAEKYYTTYSLPDSIFSMDGMDLKNRQSHKPDIFRR